MKIICPKVVVLLLHSNQRQLGGEIMQTGIGFHRSMLEYGCQLDNFTLGNTVKPRSVWRKDLLTAK